MDRRDVIDRHDNRLKARETLEADVAQAKTDLHPRAIADRWTSRQKAMASQAASDAVHLVKKNALLIGAVTVGALLFAGRRPILKLGKTIRQRRNSEQDAT